MSADSVAGLLSLTTATPTLSGTVAVGSTLTAAPGAWGPAPVTLSYQWLRSGVAISGATGATYTLVAADQGLPVTVRVTGTKSGYATASTTSAATVWKLTTATVTIGGTASVGSTLTAMPGAWGPAPVTLSYQWLRSGTAIAGATGASYVLVADDLGKTMTVKVAGTKSGFVSATSTSAATTAVAAGTLTSATPTISGTAKVGSTLTAMPGAWGPAPVTLSYQWLRSGTAIAGATGASYVLVADDLGKTMTVKVTGTKAGYTTVTMVSASTPPVASGTTTVGTLTPGTPTLSGSMAVGSTLTADPGSWTPAPVTITYQWMRGGVAISGATGATYILTAADQGQRITVTVTGKKTGYTTASRTSASLLWPLTSAVPTVSGTMTVGSSIAAAPGAWGPAPVTFSYQWLRGGVAISGATASTYTLVAADAGQLITVRVTGSKTNYTTVSRVSVARPWILKTTAPTVSGTVKVGSTLTANPGTWGPAPVTLSYQWLRGGMPIAGATGRTYALVASDLAQRVSVRVTGAKTNYTTVALTSAPTGAVAPGTLTPAFPAVTGNLTTGSVLSANAGTWGPTPVTLTYQWLRDDAPIAGAKAATFKMRAADVGHEMSVRVTGTKAGYTTATVTGSRVFIAGGMKVGNKLTFRSGSWQPAPVALKIQWYRAGVPISGATSIYYTLVAADKGKAITARATLSKAGYTSATVSASAPSW